MKLLTLIYEQDKERLAKVAGVNIKIRGEGYEKEIKIFINNLKKWVPSLKSKGFSKAIEEFNNDIIISLDRNYTHSADIGTYGLWIFPKGLTNDAFLHEVGHSHFNYVISHDKRKLWWSNIKEVLKTDSITDYAKAKPEEESFPEVFRLWVQGGEKALSKKVFELFKRVAL